MLPSHRSPFAHPGPEVDDSEHPGAAWTQHDTRSADGTAIWWRVREADTPATSPSPTLVLNDGIGCAGYAWRRLVPHFAGRYRIVHWNYRGHGRSERDVDRHRLTIEDLCDDLDAVLDAAAPRTPVALVGHSMGVQVACEYMRRRAERVCGLALLCGSDGRLLDTFRGTDIARRIFPFLNAGFSQFRWTSRAVWSRVLSTRVALEYAVRLEANTALVERDDLAVYLRHMASIDPEVFLRLMDSASRHSASDVLATIDVPTLVIAAGRDRFTPPEVSERLAATIPGAELLRIPEGTHTAPIELPHVINPAVERFLRARVVPHLAERLAAAAAAAGPNAPPPSEGSLPPVSATGSAFASA